MDIGRTVVTAQALRRWVLVVALVLALAAVPIAITVWPVRAAALSPDALRARITASAAQPFQGYAQSSGLLGLPDLPRLSQVTDLLSGTTEMRTWYAAPDRWRVDVLGEGTETDLYQTPEAQFTWDYGDNQLTRITGDQPVRLPRAADLTPPELVRRLLAVSEADHYAGLAARRVAGVDATGLRLTPAGPDTTVAHVDVWADPATGLPLQAEVTAKGGSRPVFVTRFLEIHFSVPDAAVLTPPAPRDGIGYAETSAPDLFRTLNRWQSVTLPGALAGLPRRDAVSAAAVYGSGLTSFVVIALPGRFGGQAYRQISTFGQALPSTDEASMITTGLLNVLAVREADRTFLVAGLVGPQLLTRVAAEVRK